MEFAAKEKLVVRQIHHPKQSRRKKEKKTFLLGSALNEQAAGLASFVFARTTRHYSPPPTPSCRAILASAKGFFGGG